MVQEGRIDGGAGTAAAGTGGGIDLKRDVDALRSDLSALREDIAALVGSAVHAGKARAGDATGRIADAARSRLQQLGSAWEGATDRGQELLEQAQHRIEERPLQSVGVAFLAGVLIGALVRR
jgi:ElaB/YqjD/DUF883 family membrane-anchored ribosome-binding protein